MEIKYHYRTITAVQKLVLLIVVLIFGSNSIAQTKRNSELFLEQHRIIPNDNSWYDLLDLVVANKTNIAKQQYDAISKQYLKKKNWESFLFLSNEYCYALMEYQADSSAILILEDAISKTRGKVSSGSCEFLIAHYYMARFYNLGLEALPWYEAYFSLDRDIGSLDFLASLYMGGYLFYNKQFEKAWEKWFYCLDNMNNTNDEVNFYYILAKFINKQDTEFSIYLLEYALKLNNKLSVPDRMLEYKCLVELCDVYLKRLEEKTAIKYGKMAAELIEKHPDQIIQNDARFSIYTLLSEVCIWVGDFDYAKLCIDKYKNNKNKYINPEYIDPFVSKTMGEYYFYKEQTDSSEIMFKQAIGEFIEVDGEFSNDNKLPYGYLAYIEWAKGNYNAAINYYENTLKLFSESEFNKISDEIKFVDPKKFRNVRELSTAIYAVLDMLKIYQEWHQKEPDNNTLLKIIQYSQYNSQIIHEWFKNSISDQTLMAASAILKKNNAFAVKASYELAQANPLYVDSVLIFSDAARLFNYTYMKNLKQQPRKVNSNNEIVKLSKLSFDLATINPLELDNNYGYLKSKLELLQIKMKLNEVDPSCFEMLLSDNGYDEVKTSLPDKTALLTYFINDETIYISGYNEDCSFAKKVGFKNLNTEIKKLKRNIKSGDQKAELPKLFYNKLIDSVSVFLDSTKNIIVVPDEKLIGLPFEVFCSRNNINLVSKYNLSYLYSVKNMDTSSQNPSQKLLALAPGFMQNENLISPDISRNVNDSSPVFRDGDIRHGLAPIASSIDEVNEIEQLFSDNNRTSTIVTGIEATEPLFKNIVKDNDIIHLATHGVSGNAYESGIFFSLSDTISENSDGFLRMSELYNFDINADLVVLSACKTASGKVVDGEGVMAISRGFAFAGANNVLASLWKVHDQRTKDLMVGFYKHLLEDNVSYAEALRLAKLDCIKKGFLPVDWAGFVLIGS